MPTVTSLAKSSDDFSFGQRKVSENKTVRNIFSKVYKSSFKALTFPYARLHAAKSC